MNGLIEALTQSLMSSPPTIRRLYIQSLLIFYQGLRMAIRDGNRKVVLERVFDSKMEPRQLYSCLGGKKREANQMYLDAISEIKEFIQS